MRTTTGKFQALAPFDLGIQRSGGRIEISTIKCGTSAANENTVKWYSVRLGTADNPRPHQYSKRQTMRYEKNRYVGSQDKVTSS